MWRDGGFTWKKIATMLSNITNFNNNSNNNIIFNNTIINKDIKLNKICKSAMNVNGGGAAGAVGQRYGSDAVRGAPRAGGGRARLAALRSKQN